MAFHEIEVILLDNESTEMTHYLQSMGMLYHTFTEGLPTTSLPPGVTHLICSCQNISLMSFCDTHPWKDSVVFVHPDWIYECYVYNRLCDENKFPPRLDGSILTECYCKLPLMKCRQMNIVFLTCPKRCCMFRYILSLPPKQVQSYIHKAQ